MAPQAFATPYSRDRQGNAAVSPTKVVQNATLTPPNWRETIYIHQMSHIIYYTQPNEHQMTLI